jgi:O-antigen ligase
MLTFVPKETFGNRLIDGWRGLQTYAATGEITEMSVSIRLELWRVGLRIFSEAPLAGRGEKAAAQRRLELSQTDEYSSLVAEINTFDNTYINILTASGILGFLAHMAAFILPIFAFSKFQNHQIPSIRALSMVGVMLPILYMEFGMSVSIFGTNAFRQVYASWLVLLMGLIASELNVDRKLSQSPTS